MLAYELLFGRAASVANKGLDLFRQIHSGSSEVLNLTKSGTWAWGVPASSNSDTLSKSSGNSSPERTMEENAWTRNSQRNSQKFTGNHFNWGSSSSRPGKVQSSFTLVRPCLGELLITPRGRRRRFCCCGYGCGCGCFCFWWALFSRPQQRSHF